jgi:UDP-N-acetylglucosamine 4,6-dehydratase
MTNEDPWTGATVLVTGGTGSFGRTFARLLLQRHEIGALRILSRDEFKQQRMAQEITDPRVRFLVGDVRDGDRLHRALHGVDIVIHAAALKQVPSCEYNPLEAVKTNVLGAANVIEAAIDAGVHRVLALSSDKAASPVNLYGATKLCAEKLFVQGNSYVGPGATRFSCARYGNVLGSRGSVLPAFIAQRDQGRITITDARMTRFWVTLEQAAKFVAARVADMHGGEVFVPKIPSLSVVDMAEAVAPGIELAQVGIRPGEKLHETLITVDEGRHTREMDTFYVIEPEHQWWEGGNWSAATPVPEDFLYSSDTNLDRLWVEDLRKLIEDEWTLVNANG